MACYTMYIFNLLQQCSVGLYSSGMWQHVEPDGSRQRNVPKKMAQAWNEMVPHLRRMEI
jgi:hypothetical protein